jgi:hypothetical protein
METEHGPGLFLIPGALAVTGTGGTCLPCCAVLLHPVAVLLLCAGTLLARLVHAVLSILQALALTGCDTGTFLPESRSHYGCRNEDECDHRTENDFFIHNFPPRGCRLAGVSSTRSAGPASYVNAV